MIENENPVIEKVAENTEQTVEETPPAKTYTQEEVDAIVGRRNARTRAKIEKEYQRKYGNLEEVLKAGTGKDNVEEITDDFTRFYEDKGVKIQKRPELSAKDIEVLASADANEIIRAGDEEIVEEVDRLTKLGTDNMTAREKSVFKALVQHQQNAKRSQELARIGVAENVYNSKEFREFASKFNPDIPITDIYDIFSKSQQKKEVRTMGSMKNSTSDDGTVKDFYTRDEALKFTKADFDKNPALFKAVEASMLKW